MKDDVEGFLEELGKSREAEARIEKANPQTLEDLAAVTAGMAPELGYSCTGDQILAYYQKQMRLIKKKNDSASEELVMVSDSDMDGIIGGNKGYPPKPSPDACGALQAYKYFKNRG